MAKLLRLLIFSFLSLSSLKSEAFNYVIPQGQREALMGNIGIALSGSEGSVLYNPAGAAGLDSDRISASGSLLNASSFKVDTGSGMADKTTDPSFFQIPGLVTGYSKTSWANIGFYINTDYLVGYDKLYTFTSAAYNGYMQSVANLNSLNLGVVAAKSASLSKATQFQYGLSLGVNLLENQQHNFSKTQNTVTNDYNSSFSNTSIKTTNLVGRLGVLLSSSSYSVGAMYQPLGSRVTSSYSKFAYSVSTSGIVSDDSSNTGEGLNSPPRYGLGVGFYLAKGTRVLVDMDVTEGVTKEDSDADPTVDRVDSAGVGFEHTLDSGNHIFGGVRNSRINSENLKEAWLVSTGFEYKISFIKNYFGIYHSNVTAKQNSASGSNGFTLSYLGLVIASQYAF